MNLGLNGKIALITGASRGLGFATAVLLASEGARVAINSRNAAELENARQKIESATGADVIAIPADVSAPESAQQIVGSVVERWNGLDILITNSGGPPAGKFDAFSLADWQNAVDLNFLSAVNLIRSALPYLKQSRSPAVLTITSVSIKQPIDGMVLSNSVRAATAGLTKSLALELGKDGIRFNSILPGWTATERVEHLMNRRAEMHQTTPDEEIREITSQIALGRMAQPEEFAHPAVFLVSSAASYISGVMLSVDGGYYRGTF